MPLNNFGIVDVKEGPQRESFLFRSARPDADGLDLLANFNLMVVYNLCSEPEDSREDSAIWFEACYLPPWFTDPDPVVEIAKRIYRDRAKNGSILVHCQHGRDRTGLVIGAYRLMYCGWSLDRVNAERALFGVTGIFSALDFDMDGMLKKIDHWANHATVPLE